MRIFSLRPETPFLDKFGPKNQNCLSKLRFGTQTNSNMQNSMVMFTFSVFYQKYPFWVNLVQKIKIVSFSTNLNMQTSVVVVTFSITNLNMQTSVVVVIFPFSTENT